MEAKEVVESLIKAQSRFTRQASALEIPIRAMRDAVDGEAVFFEANEKELSGIFDKAQQVASADLRKRLTAYLEAQVEITEKSLQAACEKYLAELRGGLEQLRKLSEESAQ